MIVDGLRSLFTEKLVTDDREPLYTFRLGSGGDDEFGLFAPKAGLWNQLFLAVLLQISLQMVFAVTVYKLIVEERLKNEAADFPMTYEKPPSSAKNSTPAPSPPTLNLTSIYLLGYGVIMPLALYTPFLLLQFFTVHNSNVKLAFGTLPMIVAFRTIEAMHGTSPAVVETSLGHYMVYYTTVSHFEWNVETQKRRRVTLPELGAALLRIAYFFTAVSLWLSFLMHFDYQPVPNPNAIPLDSFRLSWNLLSPAHLLNAYALAVLTYFVLATGFELTTFGEQVKGYATKPIFDNPLFSSRSIREFWGRKWDLMIHRVLRHGAFMPARQATESFLSQSSSSSSKDDKKHDSTKKHEKQPKASASAWGNFVGTLAAFVASGLLHEYCWMLIFYQYPDSDEASSSTSYSPRPLKLTLFFLYNAGTMLLEHYYGHAIAPYFVSWCPTVLISTLLVFTALPLSHWYTGDWVVGGFFDDFAIGLWHIRKLN